MKTINYKFLSSVLFSTALISTTTVFATTANLENQANRTTNSFSQIINTSSIDIVIKQSDTAHVQILDTADNVLPLIKTTVEGDTLTISTAANAPWGAFNRTEIDVYTPHVSEIENAGSGKIKVRYADKLAAVTLSGSGNIAGKNITAQSLAVDLSGSGDIDLSGQLAMKSVDHQGSGDIELSGINKGPLSVTNSGSGDTELKGQLSNLILENKGSGEIDAADLKAEQVTASLYGSGDIDLYAEQSLNAQLYGSGDIDIKGHPKHVNQEVKGSGRVRF